MLATPVRVRGRTRALLILLPLATIILSLPFYRMFDAAVIAREDWVAVLAAATLYGVSHVGRAVRLALLAAPALNMHVRTAALLHFHTAPVSFIVPFKLGELYRWQQLAWLSGNPVGSLVILLLERTLDAVVLMAGLAVVIVVGRQLPLHTELLTGLLALAASLGLFAVLIAPGCLEATQAYIMRHHSAASARRVLRLVDSARLVTNSAKERLRGNVVPLLSLSAAIWVLETGVVVLLAQQLQGQTSTFLTSLLTMTFSPQVGAGSTVAFTNLYALVGLVTLLLAWPTATILYLQRIRFPRRGILVGQRSLSVDRTRRLHLRAPGRAV